MASPPPGWEAGKDRPFAHANLGVRYQLGKRVGLPMSVAYEPGLGEPQVRPLRIFVIDPAASALDGKTTTANVPYEPLAPGPSGRLIEVELKDDHSGCTYAQADLDDHAILLGNGIAPTESDPRFHAQMAYAVTSLTHATFRRALGRQIAWPFGDRDGKPPRLRIRPFVDDCENAWYDPDAGTLNFGYFHACEQVAGRTLPNGIIFTSLSHDIVAHEMSHAMLDALRSNFSVPTSNDMTGFHEGFADLVALLQHFQYPNALRAALVGCRCKLRGQSYLNSIGQQFSQALGNSGALRCAVEGAPDHYDPALEAHQMGHLLLAAVFDAFVTVFERKVASLYRIASQGTGVLPEGDLPDALVNELARKAADLATQFLGMLIRAVDYLPPVDVRLGEYLRAIITVDSVLVPDDPWDYRGALIDAFRTRGIYPRDVPSLNQDSLLWNTPEVVLEPLAALSFGAIRFSGDPGLPLSRGEQIAQACELGEYVTQSPDHYRAFGLAHRGDSCLGADDVSTPTIESIRTLRRPGPDDRIVFDTVAEVLQVRTVRPADGTPSYELHGGATIILDSRGAPRYVIRKSVLGTGRKERREAFLASPQGQRFWEVRRRGYVQKAGMFMALCEHASP